jgi:peroxiredoxin Q/BCP
MTHLKKGDTISRFKELTKGMDIKGKKLIIYFYPKDNSPGCTSEACNLRDHYHELIGMGFDVLGISPDSEKTHQNFSQKFNLPFQLIPDVEKRFIKEFGVWGEKKMYGRTYEGVYRTTFIVNDRGVIENILDKVDTKQHFDQIIKTIKE